MPVTVTQEEMLTPEYQFFLRDMVAPDPDQYARIDREPLRPEDATTVEHMSDLLLPGYLPGEFGVCILPDGTGVVANHLKMPGVTIEMIDWWFAWHGLAPIRYKMWDKDEHLDIQTSNPERRKDSSIPMRERYWNTVDLATEDNLNVGPRQVPISFRCPVDIGFDPVLYAKFNGTIVCAGDEKAPVIMCHLFRTVEGGVEQRTRFWVGYSVIGGRPVKVLPKGERIAEERCKLMLRHNIKEYTNLAAILPEVYAQFRNQF